MYTTCVDAQLDNAKK